MALEINEIGINMRVDGDDRGAQAKDKKAKKDKEKTRSGRAACCGFDREEIVDDCVRRVLQALKVLQER
jgi:hypothetical protein